MRKRAAKMALRSSYYIWANRFNGEFLAPCLVPQIFTEDKCKSPQKTPVNQPIKSSPQSSDAKLRVLVNNLTPPVREKWLNFNSWSKDSKRWFRKNIPLYELDCLMGMDPFKNSLHEYMPFTDSPSIPSHNPPHSTTTITGSTTTPIKTLADTFRTISVGLTDKRKKLAPTSETKVTCKIQTSKTSTTASTTTKISEHISPDRHLAYASMDFGAPPDQFFDGDVPEEEDVYLADWGF